MQLIFFQEEEEKSRKYIYFLTKKSLACLTFPAPRFPPQQQPDDDHLAHIYVCIFSSREVFFFFFFFPSLTPLSIYRVFIIWRFDELSEHFGNPGQAKQAKRREAGGFEIRFLLLMMLFVVSQSVSLSVAVDYVIVRTHASCCCCWFFFLPVYLYLSI